MIKLRTPNSGLRTLKQKYVPHHYRQTWAQIDLGAVRHNFHTIKGLLDKKTKVLVAVKANAYGHGILEVSDALVSEGVDFLGVATTDEGVLLRKNGFIIPILMLGSIFPSEAEAVINNNISQAIGDLSIAKALDACAAGSRKSARVHVKVDVGMGRIGVWHKEALELVKRVARLENIYIEGIFSHFPSADEDDELTRRQIACFSGLIKEIERAGINIPYKHMANSVAVAGYKESHMNLVRPGLMVYGLYPKKLPIELKPVLSLKSRVVFLKEVPPGRSISYGGTFVTKKTTKVATIPVGYGDGLSRRLSNKGHVLIRGNKAPVIGRVCMDQTMVEVTGITGVKAGDEVVIIGRQDGCEIRVEEVAKLCDTIPYEVTCWFDNRVPRIYLK